VQRNARPSDGNGHNLLIPKDRVPRARAKDVTYGLTTCLIRPEKTKQPDRTRLVAGGDMVHYPFNAGTPTADLLTIKLLINSMISTTRARFFTMHIKNFYLCMPMTRYEYMQLKVSDIQEDVIAHYHLLDIATPDGYVYCKICQGIQWAPTSGDHCTGNLGKKTEGAPLQPEQNNAWAVDTWVASNHLLSHEATLNPYASLIHDLRGAHKMCTRGLGLELNFLFNSPFPRSLWRSGR
jgi:hypothetical protein